MSGTRTSESGNGGSNAGSDEDSWLGGGYSRSQSQTIGVLLIAGVVLVLAAAAAVFVIDIGADNEESVFVDIQTEVTTDGVAIIHESGDTIPMEELTLVVDTGVQRAETSFADIESSIDSFSAGDRAVADDENDLGFTDDDTAEQLAAGTNVQVIHEPSNTVLVDKSNVQASGDTTIEAFSVNLNLGSGGSGQSLGTLSQSGGDSKDKLEANYQFEAGDVLNESVNGTVTFSGDLLDDANSSLAEFSNSSDFELEPGNEVDNKLQWDVPVEHATEAHGFDVRLNVSVDEADIGLNESAELDVEPAEIGDVRVIETETDWGSSDTLNVSLDVPNTGDLSTRNRSVGADVTIKDEKGNIVDDPSTQTESVSIAPDGETVSVAIDTDDAKGSSVVVTPVIEVNGTEKSQENQTQEIPLPAFGEVAFETEDIIATVTESLTVEINEVLRTGENVTLVLDNGGNETTRTVSLDVSNDVGSATVTIDGEDLENLNLDADDPLNATLYASADEALRLAENQTGVESGDGVIANWNDLDDIRDDPDGDYELNNDLNKDTSNWLEVVGGDGFAPIEDFSGTFDGQGNEIADLILDDSGDNVGLFASTTGDVTIENVDVTLNHPEESDYTVGQAGDNVGGLTGVNEGTLTVSNVKVDIVAGDETTVGGVAGVNEGTITDSDVTGSVEAGDNVRAGGFVGLSNGGIMKNSQAAVSLVVGNRTAYDPSLAAGGLVGKNSGGVIESSTATGNVEVGVGDTFIPLWVGGLVGRNKASIKDSSATGNVETGNGYIEAGGLAGKNDGDISDSFATGNLVVAPGASINPDTPPVAGGLVGHLSGTISQSFATGTVEIGKGSTTGAFPSPSSAGGLVGKSQATISKSYATGAVTGTDLSNVGGLVGKNFVNDGLGTIEQSYSVGAVTGGSDFEASAGGLVGANVEPGGGTGTVDSSYWDQQTTGQDSGVGDDDPGVVGLDTTQMTGDDAETNMTDFDFGSTWVTTDGYPALQGVGGPDPTPPVVGNIDLENEILESAAEFDVTTSNFANLDEGFIVVEDGAGNQATIDNVGEETNTVDVDSEGLSLTNGNTVTATLYESSGQQNELDAASTEIGALDPANISLDSVSTPFPSVYLHAPYEENLTVTYTLSNTGELDGAVNEVKLDLKGYPLSATHSNVEVGPGIKKRTLEIENGELTQYFDTSFPGEEVDYEVKLIDSEFDASINATISMVDGF